MSKFANGLVLLLLVCNAACSNPENRIIGRWAGSGQIKMPPTGNAEIDAEEAKSINLMSIDLDLKKDHSYIERIRKTTIEGTWSAGNHTVTLLPRSINGIDAAAVKRQMDEAAARHNLKMPDMPGMAGPEQLALSSDSKSLSVPTIGQTVILQRAEQ